MSDEFYTPGGTPPKRRTPPPKQRPTAPKPKPPQPYVPPPEKKGVRCFGWTCGCSMVFLMLLALTVGIMSDRESQESKPPPSKRITADKIQKMMREAKHPPKKVRRVRKKPPPRSALRRSAGL